MAKDIAQQKAENQTLRERVEHNVIAWLLGTLVTGFVAGFSAYSSIYAIAGYNLGDERRRLQENIGQFEKQRAEFEAERERLGEMRNRIAEGSALLSSERSELDGKVAQQAAELKRCQVEAEQAKYAALNTPPSEEYKAILAGTSLYLIFQPTKGRDAVALQKRLQLLGMKIVLNEDESDLLGVTPNVIKYNRPNGLPGALALEDELARFGVVGHRNGNGTASEEFFLWMK
jgi:hypothetical protein